MTTNGTTRFSLALLLFAGCTPIVPTELVDARTAYARAVAGPAARLAPTALHNANEQLATAEQAFLDDPRSPNTRDLAYLAERKAQLAEKLAAAELEKRAGKETTQ